ncbi:DUF6702 family protein [Mucilaginibacter koreensis]
MMTLMAKPLLIGALLFELILPVKFNKPAFHPLHVSTSDISYNNADHQLEVICTIYTDDFETALGRQYKTHTDLTKPEMHKAMDALIKNYIGSHVILKAGTAAVPLNYLGYEIEREAVNVYLESNAISSPKKLIADISLLHNLYDDQINIVHMTVNKVRKSEKLDYPNTRVVQDF